MTLELLNKSLLNKKNAACLHNWETMKPVKLILECKFIYT